MADVLTPAQRQHCMSRVKSKDTDPELQLRKALWKTGLRYRLNYKLPGKPDLVFIRPKIAVFVDGCFWHSCPQHGTIPSTNTPFWTNKLLKNKLRDEKVSWQLTALGWTVLRFWEHEVKADVKTCVEKLEQQINHKEINATSIKAKRAGTNSKAIGRANRKIWR